MPGPRELAILAVLFGLSVAFHIAVWFGLGFVERPVAVALLRELDIEVVEPLPELEPEPEPEVEEEPPAAPEPEPEPIEPEPVRVPEPRPQPERRDPTPQPPAEEEPPPAQEEIADFSGETLTNEDGEAWAAPAGSGEPVEGPLGRPGGETTGRRRDGVAGGTPGGRGQPEAPPGPRLVASGDLSRQPGPPMDDLARLLQQNYPGRARQLGVEGRAVVRVRVRANGQVVPVSVVSETWDGFGEACRRTLRASPRWEPPRDGQGEAVDTVVRFTCTFSVRAF